MDAAHSKDILSGVTIDTQKSSESALWFRRGEAKAHLDAAAIAVLLILSAIWGVQQVAIKFANTGISPVFQAGLRSAGALVLLWIWATWRGVNLFERDGCMGWGLLVAVLFAGDFLFLYWGLEYTQASRGALFYYTSPFAVAIGAHFFVRGERLRLTKVVGLACAFVGVSVALAEGLSLPSRDELIGDLMVLAGAIFWGATTVTVKASPLTTISADKLLFYQLVGSAGILFALSWMLGEPGVTAPTPLVLGALAYQIIVVAFVSYLIWYWLVARYPASSLSSFAFATPLFGIVAGALILSEPITGALVVALLLVGTGLYIVNREPSGERDH